MPFRRRLAASEPEKDRATYAHGKAGCASVAGRRDWIVDPSGGERLPPEIQLPLQTWRAFPERLHTD